ncbi:ABC transporter ATP-binding protein [Candidatus Pacearchaeota archaeon]|nr:ABC transporter ATP-binding protein [Candidatus Pacearchaeota archaeon]
MEIIKLENISKKFNLEYRKPKSALNNFVNIVLRKNFRKDIHVLKNVDLILNSGEVLGIIGKNGSGKSTLLRIIAGIYEKDSGNLKINGKVIYLSGFNNGLSDRLTMRENIFLAGSLLDLSQNEIRIKFNDIVEFSGLGDFVDVEVSKFSSGMIARLAFSITIFCVTHKNPDVYLLDEVFNSGGDEDFKRKSLAKMEELIKGGAAVLLVSHDLSTIEKYCDRAIWIDKGVIVKEGNPSEIVNSYSSHYDRKSI